MTLDGEHVGGGPEGSLGLATPLGIADLVAARVASLPWEQQAEAYILAVGKNPRPPLARMTGETAIPPNDVPAHVGERVAAAVENRRVAVAALVLEKLGMKPGALAAVSGSVMEIGRTIARDTTGQLHDLVLEVMGSENPGGLIPSSVGLIPPGASAPLGLSAYAKHALARAVDDAAANWPGWVDDYEQQEIKLVFPSSVLNEEKEEPQGRRAESDTAKEPWHADALNEMLDDAVLESLAGTSGVAARSRVEETGEEQWHQDALNEALDDAILDALAQATEPAAAAGDESAVEVAEEYAAAEDEDFVSMFELLRRPLPPRDYVLKPFAERGRVSLLMGEPGCNKTTLMAHLGLAVAIGKDWGPFSTKSPGRVLWVNGEESPDESNRRWRGAGKARGQDGHRVVQDSFRRVRAWKRGGAIRIAQKAPEGVALTDRGKLLIRQIERFKPDLVVIDPLATAHSLDESSNADMADFFGLLQDIAREHKTAIVVVHHARKGSGKGTEVSLDVARGASAIAGAVRSMWLIVRKDRLHVELHCVKANNFLMPEGAQRFELVSVTINNGDDVGTLEPRPHETQPPGGSRSRAPHARAPTPQL